MEDGTQAALAGKVSRQALTKKTWIAFGVQDTQNDPGAEWKNNGSSP